MPQQKSSTRTTHLRRKRRSPSTKGLPRKRKYTSLLRRPRPPRRKRLMLYIRKQMQSRKGLPKMPTRRLPRLLSTNRKIHKTLKPRPRPHRQNKKSPQGRPIQQRQPLPRSQQDKHRRLLYQRPQQLSHESFHYTRRQRRNALPRRRQRPQHCPRCTL